MNRFFRIYLILILSIFLNLYFCSNLDGTKTKKKNKNKTDTLAFMLAYYRSTGDCLRKDNQASIAYCDKRSRGICNVNELILTRPEKNYNLKIGNDLVSLFPSCSYSFLTSGIAAQNVTSSSQEDTLKANNEYSVVNSCEELGINFIGELMTESERVLIDTPRGRIGVTADTIYNTSDATLSLSFGGNISSAQQAKADALLCLNSVFSQTEKELFTSLRTGVKLKHITCTVNGGANPCPF